MATATLQRFLRGIAHATCAWDAEWTDAQLLERYLSTRDELAFQILVSRHGPMVLNVCRRILGSCHDVEDAFQATFLIMVRKAGTLVNQSALGCWLYKVAFRVALAAKSTPKNRSLPLCDAVVGAESMDESADGLHGVLTEEVNRLPNRYRSVVVLCFLQGKTHAEAARELGCPKGTVSIRIMRAKQRLRDQLVRRGVTLSGGALVTLLESSASAALPTALLESTVEVAVSTADVLPVAHPVMQLAEHVLHGLWLQSFRKVFAPILAALIALVTIIYGIGTARTDTATSSAVATDSLSSNQNNNPASIDDTKPWGTISGRVVWKGELPVPKPNPIYKGREINANQPWVIHPANRGIRWAVVWLEPHPKKQLRNLPVHPSLQKPRKKTIALNIDQDDFRPPVLIMREGQVLAVTNQNTQAECFLLTGLTNINPGLNVRIPSQNTYRVTNLKADPNPIIVRCTFKRWTLATLWVFTHPYAAVSDADGKFTINNTPAGQWRLKIWHPSSGWHRGQAGRNGEPITIRPEQTTVVGDRYFALEENNEKK